MALWFYKLWINSVVHSCSVACQRHGLDSECADVAVGADTVWIVDGLGKKINIRLKKFDVRRAVSFLAVIDIVFYKDENDNLYRLKQIEDNKPRTSVESLHHAMCLDHYAPRVIEGEIVSDYKNGMEIKDKNNRIYHIQNNGEEFKFWDVMLDEVWGLFFLIWNI